MGCPDLPISLRRTPTSKIFLSTLPLPAVIIFKAPGIEKKTDDAYTVGQLPVIRILFPTHTLLALCLAGKKSCFSVPSDLLS